MHQCGHQSAALAKGGVTNYGEGGYKTRGGGGGEWSFTPTEKGGTQSFSQAEVGGGGVGGVGLHTKFWGSFNTGAWDFSHID